MKTLTIVQNTFLISGLLMLLAGAWLKRGKDERGYGKKLFWGGFILTLIGAATATELVSGFLEGVLLGK